MDYGKVLSRAWAITWRWKILWILGFLASLGRSFGSSNSGYRFNEGDFNYWQVHPYLGPRVWVLVAGVVCLAVLIGIALWVVSIIARGGLIAGVQQVEDDGSTAFGQAWRVGVKRFWTLFGISILTALPILFVVILGVAVLILFILGTAGAIERAAEVGGAIGVVASIFWGGLFCCGTIFIAIVLDQIRVYAERAAILEGLGWIDAFKRGWQVLKQNLGPTIIVWLIFAVIGLIFAGLIVAAVAAFAVPFVAVVANTKPGAWLIAPLCCGGIVALIVGGLIGAVVETFTSATWTLTYRELTGSSEPVVEPAATS
jgi:hypothetical protein